jgi:hypothetical protein
MCDDLLRQSSPEVPEREQNPDSAEDQLLYMATTGSPGFI